MKSPILSCAIVLAFSLGALSALYADSATWNLNPINGNWNIADNWTPATVPNGPSDIATFDISNRPAVTISSSVEVSELVFNALASAYTLTVARDELLTISGAGVINNSGTAQNFVISSAQVACG